jgi:prepilin-type N-terminal cleavage/methylation domain-containing protein
MSGCLYRLLNSHALKTTPDLIGFFALFFFKNGFPNILSERISAGCSGTSNAKNTQRLCRFMRVQTGSSAMEPTGKRLGCRRDQQPTPKAILFLRFRSRRLQAGYSLIEVVMAAAIIALVYGMIINCYIQSGMKAEWSGYSLAAQSLATEQIEQARSAIWDLAGGTNASGVNDVTNLILSSRSYDPSSQTWYGYTTGTLDVPYASTNAIIATNYVSIQIINVDNSTIPPIQVQMVRVDTVWPFFYRGTNLYFTNTTATLLAPDNRNPNAL